jgi:hypothetical protein
MHRRKESPHQQTHYEMHRNNFPFSRSARSKIKTRPSSIIADLLTRCPYALNTYRARKSSPYHIM